MYLAGGLMVPESIRAATGEYRDDSDPMGEFLRTSVVEAEGMRVSAGRLYDAYLAWCSGSMVSPLNQHKFGRKMGDRGHRRVKIGTWFYEAIDLTAEAQAATEAFAADHQPGSTAHSAKEPEGTT